MSVGGPAIEEVSRLGAGGGVGASELAELMSAFNAVTSRLQSTHEALQREVSRLRAELREANEQLQRSKRLAALGEMAAGIAHEVRNPLGSIGLYASMLDEDLAGRPAERELARKIGAAVRGLNAVVGDVLTFAREVRVRPAACEAGELLERAVEACCPGAGVRVVRADLERGERVELSCDAGLVHQALVNVVRNACEAMADLPGRAHTLTLDAGVREAGVAGEDAGDGGPMAALVVEDTGPGIPPEVVDRMFNPFFTTRHTGTGLGLAIVHRIVDAHGGRVVVSSGAAGGARFELLFPAGRGGGALSGDR